MFLKVSLLLIDEASRVEDNLYDAGRPTLAVSDGDLWLMSTPYGPGLSRHLTTTLAE
jgi:hypothetical protein